MEEKSLFDQLQELDPFKRASFPKSRYVDALTDYLTRRPHSAFPPRSLQFELEQITAPRTRNKLERSYRLAEYLQELYEGASNLYRNYLRERFAAIGYLSGCFGLIGTASILNVALDSARISGEQREIILDEFVSKLAGVFTETYDSPAYEPLYLALIPDGGDCPTLTMTKLRNCKDLEGLKADFARAESVFELYCKHLIAAWDYRRNAHTDVKAVLDVMRKYAFYGPALKAKAEDLLDALKTSKQVYVPPETLCEMFKIKTRKGKIDVKRRNLKERVFPERLDLKINRARYRDRMAEALELAGDWRNE